MICLRRALLGLTFLAFLEPSLHASCLGIAGSPVPVLGAWKGRIPCIRGGGGGGGGMEIEGPREEIEEEEEEDVLRKQERNRYTRRMANGVDVSHNASRVPDCPWRHRPSISAVDHF